MSRHDGYVTLPAFHEVEHHRDACGSVQFQRSVQSLWRYPMCLATPPWRANRQTWGLGQKSRATEGKRSSNPVILMKRSSGSCKWSRWHNLESILERCLLWECWAGNLHGSNTESTAHDRQKQRGSTSRGINISGWWWCRQFLHKWMPVAVSSYHSCYCSQAPRWWSLRWWLWKQVMSMPWCCCEEFARPAHRSLCYPAHSNHTFALKKTSPSIFSHIRKSTTPVSTY